MGVFVFIYLALFIIGSFAEDDTTLVISKRWAVLVASSTGWSNYRHQADICHAYQIVKANGIPTENIITMMADDIAYNTRNPTKGKIVNRPKGDNVYKDIVIDYKGTDVNKNHFLNIITGNKSAMQFIGTGKVVEGGPNDRIFINFVNHGSNGLLAFPDDYLYADQLNAALNLMYENSTYSKMLLYIEACKSGSMFDGIIGDNKNVLVITAAAPRENSYGCYCGSQSGPYKTCLGDLFSVLWMENIDATILELSAINRTVFTDFNELRTNTTKSNVMIYGDFDVGREKLSSFVGFPKNKTGQSSTKPISTTLSQKMTVSSRNVHEHTIHQLLMDDKLTADEKHHLAKEMRKNNEMRIVIDSVFQDIYFKVVKERPDIKMEIGEFNAPQDLNLSLDMFPCYRHILNKISESCFSLPRNSYALQRLQIFANLCVVDKYIHEMVRNVIVRSCSKITKNIENVY